MKWWEIALRLVTAVAVGCVIGVEREKKNRPAGMRTHVLVCVGAALVAVTEALVVADTLRLNQELAGTGEGGGDLHLEHHLADEERLYACHGRLVGS